MPNGEPEVITRPKTLAEKLINLGKKAKWYFLAVLCGIVLFLILLLNYFEIIDLSNFLPFLPTKHQIVAKVNGEKIYKEELEAAKGLFAVILSKEQNDPAVKKQALNFAIDRRLLEKEAQKRNIDVYKVVNQRFLASISQYQTQQQLEEAFRTNTETYRAYLAYQAIQEALKPIVTQWVLLDYLSIRYHWNDNPQKEEQDFQNIASKKIQEYYRTIKSGLDIKEAIQQRCQDPEINYLPFDNHNKVYLTTFNGQACREQRINFTVSQGTNPDWGGEWLRQVFKLNKGLNPIMDFSQAGVGMFFIINILDKSEGISFSLEDLVNNLRSSNDVKIYEQ